MTPTLATAFVLACIALGIVVSKWRAAVAELDQADEHAANGWTAARTAEKLATKSAQEAARLRQRLLLQSARVFPAAPRPGANLRVVPEGESPIYDAFVAETVTPIKRAPKRKPAAAKKVVGK